MWFYVLSFLLRASLAWWPGPPATATDSDPVYNNRIAVVNTLKSLPHLQEALHEWNACGADAHLHVNHDVDPYSPGNITITKSDDGGAYGGWSGTYGVVLLGDGWTRSRAVIEHEIGHALGFGHAADRVAGDAFTTIMGGGEHVSSYDCEGLRRYYG